MRGSGHPCARRGDSSGTKVAARPRFPFSLDTDDSPQATKVAAAELAGVSPSGAPASDAQSRARRLRSPRRHRFPGASSLGKVRPLPLRLFCPHTCATATEPRPAAYAFRHPWPGPLALSASYCARGFALGTTRRLGLRLAEPVQLSLLRVIDGPDRRQPELGALGKAGQAHPQARRLPPDRPGYGALGDLRTSIWVADGAVVRPRDRALDGLAGCWRRICRTTIQRFAPGIIVRQRVAVARFETLPISRRRAAADRWVAELLELLFACCGVSRGVLRTGSERWRDRTRELRLVAWRLPAPVGTSSACAADRPRAHGPAAAVR